MNNQSVQVRQEPWNSQTQLPDSLNSGVFDASFSKPSGSHECAIRILIFEYLHPCAFSHAAHVFKLNFTSMTHLYSRKLKGWIWPVWSFYNQHAAVRIITKCFNTCTFHLFLSTDGCSKNRCSQSCRLHSACCCTFCWMESEIIAAALLDKRRQKVAGQRGQEQRSSLHNSSQRNSNWVQKKKKKKRIPHDLL